MGHCGLLRAAEVGSSVMEVGGEGVWRAYPAEALEGSCGGDVLFCVGSPGTLVLMEPEWLSCAGEGASYSVGGCTSA